MGSLIVVCATCSVFLYLPVVVLWVFVAHVLSNWWWWCFLNLLVLFLFACVFLCCSALSSLATVLNLNSNIKIIIVYRCVWLVAVLSRMISVWHQSTARAIRKHKDPSALLWLSVLWCHTLLSAATSRTHLIIVRIGPVLPYLVTFLSLFNY